MRIALSWPEFDALCDQLVEDVKHVGIDLIIGIARGGLPLSVALSHRLQCRPLGVLLANKSVSEKEFALSESPFFVSDLLVPDVKPETVLLVDDVVALGDLFAIADERIVERFGNQVQRLHVSLFADPSAITRGPYAGLIKSLRYARTVNNSKVWIDFPWERPETWGR